MKKAIVILVLLLGNRVKGQVQINLDSYTAIQCFGDCTGSITYSISGASGPFSVSVSNPVTCTTPTLILYYANSTIGINNFCHCAGNYTFTFYDGSNNMIGTRTWSFINPGTSVLTVSANSIPATCATCCTGSVYCNSTGGSTMWGPSVFYIDGNYLASMFWPAWNVCPGVHTLCAKDNVGCMACTTFTMGFSTGIDEASSGKSNLMISPNPSEGVYKVIIADEENGNWEKINITTITGQVVEFKKISWNADEAEIDISNQPAGIYFLNYYSKNRSCVYKLLKQ